jgi:hypothetical protein
MRHQEQRVVGLEEEEKEKDQIFIDSLIVGSKVPLKISV